MGSAHTKPSENSTPTGLERAKTVRGYERNRDFANPRQSTAQKYTRVESADRRDFDETRKKGAERVSGGTSSGSGRSYGKTRSKKDGGGARELTDGSLEKLDSDGVIRSDGRRRSGKEKKQVEDEMVNGWPKWLVDNVPQKLLAGLVPKSAETYEKIDKVGQGTYSNVFKARDRETGKIVALKKVKFDTSEPESIKFMAREIMILQRLDHPNIVKLEGLATSRLHYSLYLVFEYMQTDLARIISRPEERLTEPQVKCYMQQLLSGLQHCHERGILHRDIKGSNILIDKSGMLKIADFGLANFYGSRNKHPLTSRVVTLWYRAPELLLGATDYGVGIDLWSAGCLLAEMFTGSPIMPGRSEVEQLYKIFKLCGTPPEEYWKRFKNSKALRPPKSYRPCLVESFVHLPPSSLDLLSKLLAINPGYRGSASSALNNEFFSTMPPACSLSGLPVVFNEEDEQREAIEQIKYMNASMKRRSHERRKKELAATGFAEDDKLSSKLELKMTVERNAQNEEQAGSATSSAYSEAKPDRLKHKPPLIFPPVTSNQKVAPKPSDGYSEDVEINEVSLPPMPRLQTNYKNGDRIYRVVNNFNRAVSTKEYRSLNERQHLVRVAIDD